MENNSLWSMYWSAEKSVADWLYKLLPSSGVFLPAKLTAGGISAMAENAENKTIAEKAADYGAGVANSLVVLPQTSSSPEVVAAVKDFSLDTRENIGEGLTMMGDTVTKALTPPDWMKYAIVAVVLISTYNMTKKA